MILYKDRLQRALVTNFKKYLIYKKRQAKDFGSVQFWWIDSARTAIIEIRRKM